MPAKEARLNYPRGLAFEPKLNSLFISNSGWQKINVLDFNQNRLFPFMGTGISKDAENWRVLGTGATLSGLWAQKNEEFTIATGYGMTSFQGSLWTVDSLSQRILESPLLKKTNVKMENEIGNFYRAFRTNFPQAVSYPEPDSQNPFDWYKRLGLRFILHAIAEGIFAEIPSASFPRRVYGHAPGHTYWKYGLMQPGQMDPPIPGRPVATALGFSSKFGK